MVLGIFCAGSLGKEIYDLVNQHEVLGEWQDIIFIDDIIEEKFV